MTSSHEKVNLLLSLSGRMEGRWREEQTRLSRFRHRVRVLFAAAPSSNFIVFKTFTQYSILSSVNAGTQIKFSGFVDSPRPHLCETDATGRLGNTERINNGPRITSNDEFK